MDTKALAKSKRAHSQHLNKKHNRNPSSKAPSASPAGTDDPKKPPGKQLPEKTHQFRGAKPLPSNWDRYEEEEDDSALYDPSVKNTSQTVDVVPKSKGADYRYLISEAESQSMSNVQLDGSPLFDDVLTDFYQGYGSLLSAKGQGIQLRMQDENFVVEDEATTSNEASFLSLDLHLLAEQLGKIDLARRLFIDPEMLPPELCTDESQIRPFESAAASGSEEVKINSKDTAHHGIDELEDEIDGMFSSSHHGRDFQSSVTSVPAVEGSSSEFEAASATAELDEPLDSFTGAPTQTPDLSKPKTVIPCPGDSIDDLIEETSNSILEGIAAVELDPTQPLRTRPDMSKPTSVSPNLNSALDDLFEETSSSYIVGGTASVQLDPAETLRNSSALSKPSVVAANFDDDLDDLLNETSSSRNQNSALQSREVIMPANANSTLSSSSSISSKSKALDDFDAWFDTV